MIGVVRPPTGAFQIRLLFGAAGSGDQVSGRFLSSATPFWWGPRQKDQSAAAEFLAKAQRTQRDSKSDPFREHLRRVFMVLSYFDCLASFAPLRETLLAFISNRGRLPGGTAATSARKNNSSRIASRMRSATP